MHLLIITPIFSPAPGGAATYYDLLAHGLLAQGVVNKVSVVTEQFPGVPEISQFESGTLTVYRWFPFRAGGQMNWATKYWRYGKQNFQYFLLPSLIKKIQPDVVLIHSSFHNFHNLMRFVAPRLRRYVVLVADVRDHQMPIAALSQLVCYESVVACSENALAHVKSHHFPEDRVVHIPVIQETLAEFSDSEIIPILAQHGLKENGYLLYSGLLKKEKGVALLLEAYRAYQLRGNKEALVLVGIVKDTRLAEYARGINGVHVLGSLARTDLLKMVSKAALNVSLSVSEGMPRACLEALALGCPVILPLGIPEFSRHCPDSVACSMDPIDLAKQFERVVANGRRRTYPIEMHGLDSVLPAYTQLFQKLIAERT